MYDAPHFAPSVEIPLEGQSEDDVFITDIPFKLIKGGKVQSKVPLIIGVNELDGVFSDTAGTIS